MILAFLVEGEGVEGWV